MAAARKQSIETEIDRLYGAPLGEFTATRDALAKRLRDEGARDDAARVKALRKPTTAAWAVNQLSRGRQGRLQELLRLGKQLRKAQERLVQGRDANVLELSGRERELVQELVRDAAAVLREHGAGSSEATLDEVARTLHAAAIDADAAEEVERGRLIKERSAIGLGLGGAGAPASKRPAKRARASKSRKKAVKDDRAAAREAAAAARRAAADERARERLAAAERELAAARAELRSAQAAARDAERGAERAAARERRATAALDKLRKR